MQARGSVSSYAACFLNSVTASGAESTMRKVLMFSGIFVVLFGFFIPNHGAAVQFEQPEHVIIITIDGCRPDKLLEANTPNIDYILGDAAYSWTAQTVYPSSTPEAHASLFTGTWPENHTYGDPGDFVLAETMFQVFEEMGYETCLVDGKGGRIAGLEVDVSYVIMDIDYRWIDEEWVQGSEDPNGDLRVMENVIEILVENSPTLTFVLLPQIDTAGHLYGHTSEEYLRAIEKADQAIGVLIDNLKKLGIYESTLLVILSDHGMTGTDHGSRGPGDMTIPLIISGPGVEVDDFEGGRIIDVAPTVTALFGLRAPANAEGRNLFEEVAPVEPMLTVVAAIVGAAMICAIFIRKRRKREAIQPAPPA
jgi:predicted AlkP superfamily pyrophosphatase or phosphodiesterase